MVDALLKTLSDDELLATVQRLTARSNIALADLLAHLGEVELRGIHRTRACASLYTYCIYELRMSEDAAYRRSKAARLVREHPELRDAIEKGEIHLTGLLLIGPHLGGERHAELLQRARFRSKREIERLVAEIDPKPEVPTLVTPLGPVIPGPGTHRDHMEALGGPIRMLPQGRRPEDWTEEGKRDNADDADDAGGTGDGENGVASRENALANHLARARDDASAASRPARPLHYKVQFTASQEFVDLLNEARDLLGHENPRPALPDVQLRALRVFVNMLKKQKRAAIDAAPARKANDNAVAATDAPARKANDDAVAATDAPARKARDGDAVAATDAPARKARDAGAETDTAPERVNAHASEVRASRSSDRVAGVGTGASEDRVGTRHVPAPVRREVWDRDGARCAYCDARGVRCEETSRLEVHHRLAHALGGPPTVDNLELRCRAHNTLAAEEDFGRAHLDEIRLNPGACRRVRDR